MFDDDTQIFHSADGWRATVSDRWDGASGVPNGGYLLAIVTRALLADVGMPDPLSVSAIFVRPGQHGAALVTTDVIKVGRRVGFATGTLCQHGVEVVRAQVAFGDLERTDGPHPCFESGAPPQLPAPQDCLDPLDAMPAVQVAVDRSVLGRLELRLPTLPGWVAGTPGGDPAMTLWLRMRDGREPDVLSLVQLVDGLPPVVADLGGWSTTVELTVHVRRRPAPGWLRARVITRHVSNGLHEEDVELWDSTDRLVAQSRQLALALPLGGTR